MSVTQSSFVANRGKVGLPDDSCDTLCLQDIGGVATLSESAFSATDATFANNTGRIVHKKQCLLPSDDRKRCSPGRRGLSVFGE